MSEHVDIVICLDKGKVGAFCMFKHLFTNAADIGHIKELSAGMDNGKGDRFFGVMRRREGSYVDVANVKILTRIEITDISQGNITDYWLHCAPGSGIRIDGNSVLAAHYAHTLRVVDMVMGDKKCGKLVGRQPEFVQRRSDRLSGHAGID